DNFSQGEIIAHGTKLRYIYLDGNKR
ncbi:MAG: hypothetical protein ACJAZR_002683, partial [Sediminicola sp.]